MAKNLKADQRKEVTIESVVKLCSEQDPATITTAGIAQKMKLTQGALFRHFSSKEAVWVAVIEWVAQKLLNKVTKSVDTKATKLEQLEAMFSAHIEFVCEHPGAPRILLSQLQKNDDSRSRRLVKAILTLYRERIEEIVIEGIQQKEIRKDLSPDAVATHYVGLVQGIVIRHMLASSADRTKSIAKEQFAIFRQGITANPSLN